MPDQHESLWTALEVARYLRVSKSFVYHAAADGRLPCLRQGALLRFEPRVIREYMMGEQIPEGKLAHG